MKNKTIAPLLFAFLVVVLTACGGGGGGGSNLSPSGGTNTTGGGTTTLATQSFAYAANRSDGVLSVFTVDSTTGNLAYHGYKAITGEFTTENVQLHPSEKFLYAISGSRIYGFSIDSDTGALTAINDLDIGGFNARAMVMNTAGTVAYVADRSNDTISIFGIDTTTGALTSMGTVSTGQNPVDLKIHPNGALLYSVNRDDHTVSVFPINSDGSLGAESTAYNDTSMKLTSLAFTPSGDYAYLTIAESSGVVKRFSVDINSGTLNFQSSTTSVGDRPQRIKLNAAGTYAYIVTLGSSNNVLVYSVAASDGALSTTAMQTISAENDPDNLLFAPGGSALYVGNSNTSDVSIFTIGSNGMLTKVDNIRTRSGVRAVAIKAGSGTVSFAAKHLYVPNPNDSSVNAYTIDSISGNLFTPPTMTTVGTEPRQIVFAPSGTNAYVINAGSSDIYAFSVDSSTGALTANGISSIAAVAGINLARLAVDPSGRFLYALDNQQSLGNSGNIFLFNINANGTLTYVSSKSSGGFNPENLIIHPAGRYMYVMNSYGDNITLFSINPDDGSLTQKNTFTGVDRPLHATILPNGRYIYISIENEDALRKYSMDDNNGDLGGSSSVTLPPGGTASVTTYNVAVAPSGNYVYLVGSDGSINWYSTDTNGNLTYVSSIMVSTFPRWLEISPDGKHAYGLASTGVERFTIDTASGAMTDDGLTALAGLGGYQQTLTLDRVKE
ncbi:MAG: beta-propeller fold lactonase family protein [Gammaproteobacteria bacterium]